MTDQEMVVAMLVRAGVNFKVDTGNGWCRRVVLPGDRCFVFKADGSLAGIRDEDDKSFDEF